MDIKKVIFGIFGFSAGVYAAVIPLNSGVKMENGAYSITGYQKKVSKPLEFMYVGDTVSQVGKKKEVYRVYISKNKIKLGDGVYRVWLSFVDDNYFKNLKNSIKKANEEAYKAFHRKPSLSAEEAANKVALLTANPILTEVNCNKKQIITIGIGAIRIRIVYKVDKKAPLNEKIYNLVCENGKTPVTYIKY